MPNPPIAHNPLPSPKNFRAWLGAALKQLQVSPYTLAPDLDLGRNTVATFLKNGKADIRLGTAKALHAYLSRVAEEKGETLPAIEGLSNG